MSIASAKSRLADVNSEAQRLRADVSRELSVRNGLVKAAINVSVDEERRSEYLQQILNKALKDVSLASSSGPDTEELVALRKEVDAAKGTVGELQAIVGASKVIRSLDEAIRAQDLQAALAMASEMEAAVAALPRSETPLGAVSDGEENGDAADGSRAVAVLKRLARRRRTRLEVWLRGLVAEAVSVSFGAVRVQTVVAKDGARTSLSAVFQGLYDLDLMGEVAADLAGPLFEDLVLPLLAARRAVSPSTSHPTATSSLFKVGLEGAQALQKARSCLQSARAAASAPEERLSLVLRASKLAPEAALERLTVLLTFLHEELFDAKLSLTAGLGRVLLDKGSSASPLAHANVVGGLRLFLEASLPAGGGAGLAEAAAALEGPVLELERRLFAMGYSRRERGPLGELVRDVGVVHARRRRSHLLSRGRALMLGDYHNCVSAREAHDRALVGSLGSSDEDPALGEAPIQGTFAADVRLWASELVGEPGDEDLDWAEDLSPDPTGRFEDRRGVLLLPQCQVTTVAMRVAALCHAAMREAAGASPDAALLLYHGARDVLDLFRALVPTAHGAACREVPRLSALLHNDCCFLAHNALVVGYIYRSRMPPPLHRSACLVDLAQPLRRLAGEALGAALQAQQEQLREAFAGGGALDEAVLRRALHQLSQLRAAWQGVLSRRTYGVSIGSLCDMAIANAAQSVTALREASAQEAQHLHASCGALRAGMAELFAGGEKEALARAALWKRFAALHKVLGAGLAEVAELLAQGEFRDLSAAELQQLIKILHPHSASRATLLATVQQL